MVYFALIIGLFMYRSSEVDESGMLILVWYKSGMYLYAYRCMYLYVNTYIVMHVLLYMFMYTYACMYLCMNVNSQIGRVR